MVLYCNFLSLQALSLILYKPWQILRPRSEKMSSKIRTCKKRQEYHTTRSAEKEECKRLHCSNSPIEEISRDRGVLEEAVRVERRHRILLSFERVLWYLLVQDLRRVNVSQIGYYHLHVACYKVPPNLLFLVLKKILYISVLSICPRIHGDPYLKHQIYHSLRGLRKPRQHFAYLV
jgi:hypothetical protein